MMVYFLIYHERNSENLYIYLFCKEEKGGNRSIVSNVVSRFPYRHY